MEPSRVITIGALAALIIASSILAHSTLKAHPPTQPAALSNYDARLLRRLDVDPQTLNSRVVRNAQQLREALGRNVAVVPDPFTGRPHHIFCFDRPLRPRPVAVLYFDSQSDRVFGSEQVLTPRTKENPVNVAVDFLKQVSEAYELTPSEVESVVVQRTYSSAHNGVTHVTMQQRYRGLDVFDAVFTVNVDKEGRVINAGGDLYPQLGLPVEPRLDAEQAVTRAASLVAPQFVASYGVRRLDDDPAWPGELRFYAAPFNEEIRARLVVFPLGSEARLGWTIRVLEPMGVHLYQLVIDATNGTLLYRQNLTMALGHRQEPHALVFDRASPQPPLLHPSTPPTGEAPPPPFVARVLKPLRGDTVASPGGWIGGDQIETVGNNAIVREDRAGDSDLTLGSTASDAGGNLSFPLTLGPGSPQPTTFTESAITNIFYWINVAHDYFYGLGFDEQSGNYQTENFGRGGKGNDPIRVEVQKGADLGCFPNCSTPVLNNAYFVPAADGRSGRIATLLWDSLGTNPFLDGSFDTEVILHEYTHGVSSRLVKNLVSTGQTGAMCEGWSDFFALNYLTPPDGDIDGLYPIGSYASQNYERGIRSRPYTTRFDVNNLTYANMGQVAGVPQIHADGEIWVEALWEMRANLIGRWGFEKGRYRAGLLVIDGMKLSPPRPTMVDMRDAILMADRQDFAGANQDLIWAAFAKRGLGFLAYGGSSSTMHVLASRDMPRTAGTIKFYEPAFVIGEPVRVVAGDSNSMAATLSLTIQTSSGDEESLILARTGWNYFGSLPSGYGSPSKGNGALQLRPGDLITAFYIDEDNGAGQPHRAAGSAQVIAPYELSFMESDFEARGGEPLNLKGNSLTKAVDLPFVFPYFGQEYRRVFVSTNGMIDLLGPNASGANAQTQLIASVAIAPFWFDLRTDGDAQPDEDIYYTQTSDSVTFRWAAESAPSISGTSSQSKPVNFSATLYRDGRIQFRYGNGNRDLTATLGDTGSPTVGLSRGTEVYGQFVGGYDGARSLERARIVTLTPGTNQ
ncbi:MAG: M36 family metallopeptidase [Acidobacteria bacterium]|nr:M36 family metallopeptidase [Acidobacteriota bacterium]